MKRILKISISVIDEKLVCDHLVLSCKLFNKDTSISSYFMIDCDVTSIDFIDISFALFHEFHFISLQNSRFLIVVDDKSFAFDNVTHVIRVLFMIRNHLETIEFYATKLEHYLVILSMPWLKLHDLINHWSQNCLSFSSQYCMKHCLRSSRLIIVFDVDTQFDKLSRFFNSLNTSNENLKFNQVSLTKINAIESKKFKNKKINKTTSTIEFIVTSSIEFIVMRTTSKEVLMSSTQVLSNIKSFERIKKSYTLSLSSSRIEFAIKVASLKQMRKKLTRLEDYVISIVVKNKRKNIKITLKKDMKSLNMSFIEVVSFNTWLNKSKKNKSIEIYSIFIRDIEQVLQEKKVIDSTTKLFKEHHHIIEVFFKKASNKLLSHRFYDHKIFLMKNFKLVNDSLYDMFKEELKVMTKYIEEMLDKSFIRASSSSTINSILFVKKSSDDFRFCVDYRQFNFITIKNKYLLPLVKETLDRICKVKIFFKIDIIVVFHKFRMIEGEEWKIAFKTRYDLYEYMIMFFDLINALSTFQHFINDVLQRYLNVFCTTYIDDILIYNNFKKDHIKHVNKILERLKKANIQANIDKFEFHKIEVTYLNLIVDINDIRMNSRKIQIIVDWETSICIRDIQVFIDFVNFYRRFIKDFSKIVTFLIKTIRKDKVFIWTKNCQLSFDTFKSMFISTSILTHFDFIKKIILKTNVFDNVFVEIMSQYDDDELLHSIAFFFKKHTIQKINYEIYDKKLLTIIRAFEKWRSKLKDFDYSIKVFIDHRNLEWFMFIKQLSRRQARWAQFLIEFNFVITYRSKKLNAKLDVLIKRSKDLLKRENKRLRQQMQIVLKSHNLNIDNDNDYESASNEFESQCCVAHMSKSLKLCEDDVKLEFETNIEENVNIMITNELFNKNYVKNSISNKVLQALCNDDNHFKNLTLNDCKVIEDRLYYRERKYVSTYHSLKLRLFKLHHDFFVDEHQERVNTYELLARNYYWNDMQDFVRKYCNHCNVCKRNKSFKFKKQNVFKSLKLSQRRWQNINIDLIIDFFDVDDNNAIVNIIDRLTKKRYHIACNTKFDFENLTILFMKHVWCRHDLSRIIISNKNSQFISDFWERLCERLSIEAKLSSTWHSKIDDQIERINDIMKQYLRVYVNYNQNDWLEWLLIIEFVKNNTIFNITKVSLFYVNKRFHSRMSVESSKEKSHNRKKVVVDAFAKRMKKLESLLKEQMTMTQVDYEQYVNKIKTFVFMYKVDDMIYLNIENIVTRRFCFKLNHKNIDFYKVIKILDSISIKLKLLSNIQDFHFVFHVHLLSFASKNSSHFDHIQSSSSSIFIDEKDNDEWEMKKIVNSRYDRKSKRLQYRVKWIDHAKVQWEDYIFLKNAFESRFKYHFRYLNRVDSIEIEFTQKLSRSRERSRKTWCDMNDFLARKSSL